MDGEYYQDELENELDELIRLTKCLKDKRVISKLNKIVKALLKMEKSNIN